MDSLIVYSGIYLIGVFISAISQVLLKKSCDAHLRYSFAGVS